MRATGHKPFTPLMWHSSLHAASPLHRVRWSVPHACDCQARSGDDGDSGSAGHATVPPCSAMARGTVIWFLPQGMRQRHLPLGIEVNGGAQDLHQHIAAHVDRDAIVLCLLLTALVGGQWPVQRGRGLNGCWRLETTASSLSAGIGPRVKSGGRQDGEEGRRGVTLGRCHLRRRSRTNTPSPDLPPARRCSGLAPRCARCGVRARRTRALLNCRAFLLHAEPNTGGTLLAGILARSPPRLWRVVHRSTSTSVGWRVAALIDALTHVAGLLTSSMAEKNVDARSVTVMGGGSGRRERARHGALRSPNVTTPGGGGDVVLSLLRDGWRGSWIFGCFLVRCRPRHVLRLRAASPRSMPQQRGDASSGFGFRFCCLSLVYRPCCPRINRICNASKPTPAFPPCFALSLPSSFAALPPLLVAAPTRRLKI